MDATHQFLLDAFPKSGLFAGKEWMLSPRPFPLTRGQVKQIRRLGSVLQRFVSASNDLYFRSANGTLPEWIHHYLDQGKPSELIGLAQHPETRDRTPQVIRPDLLLTESGFAMTELDSVPGGIGLTAWLNQIYAKIPDTGDVIGGKAGMIEGFRSLHPDGADLLVSEESGDYRPEMEWLAEQLGDGFDVFSAEDYVPKTRDLYRFFELFDLEQIHSWKTMAEGMIDQKWSITPPFKPWMEEKMWLALFWSRPLRDVWIRALRKGNFEQLQRIIPRSWIVDPTPLPHHAVIPGLDIHSWEELEHFSQQERQLVLKVSGYSELAWGSRSVRIGSDLSQTDWSNSVREAVCDFDTQPWVLQDFHKAKRIKHPYWDTEGKLQIMEGRVRLCPYYFVDRQKSVTLGGVLATIVPADKKIIHGMRDGILVPCSLEA